MEPNQPNGQRRVRNFCIIAHIDHGKSTLADRLIDLTKAVSSRKMHAQRLDTMELEQERGITIKAQAIRMEYKSAQTGEESVFNLIDTPGHVDFNYEVSRSLAACEGAVLLVDATQGIEAQTISNAYLALEHDLEIIPVINKVDMAAAEPQKVMLALNQAFGTKEEEVLCISARTGQGVEELADAIQQRIPPPAGAADAPLKALIFDYKYDSFKGIIAYVRVVDGMLRRGEKVRMMRSGKSFEANEIGFFNPDMAPMERLEAGSVGYVATGLKDIRDVRVGETLTTAAEQAAEPLPGYKPLQPVVFTGVYPVSSDRYLDLKDAMAKLQLNDAALFFDPESSAALGFGLRCGFLGLLHMEIVQERLEREYGLEVITTSPSVKYEVKLSDGTELTVDNPSKMPRPERIASIAEPWAEVKLLAPIAYFGAISELVSERRGQFGNTEYLPGADGAGGQRIMLNCHIPLSEMLVGFHDKLKSATSGYGSMDYQLAGYRPASMVKLDVLVNQQVVDALCALIDKSRAEAKAREIASYLKEFIPRQMFEVPIQVAIGGRILARENIKALRKNVLAKCYGGDVTRKRKLLEKQAKGKKRMKKIGRVEVPQEAFMAVLKLNS